MRGDPEFDHEIDELYRKEKRKKRSNLKILRIVVCLLGAVAIVLLYTWSYRPTRVAVLPFILGIGLLKSFDPHWKSLNIKFTYSYIGICAAFYFLRLLLMLAS